MFLGLSAAFLGPFLIYRHMTMVANALSHTILLGLSGAYFIMQGHTILPTYALLAASIVSALLTMSVYDILCRFKIAKDASIGFVFTLFLALGIILISVAARNTHIGIELVMGNIDCAHRQDLFLLILVAVINACTVVCFRRGLISTTFDPVGARCMGFVTYRYDYMIALITSLTMVAAFKVVGIFMSLAIFVLPVLCAAVFVKRMVPLIILSFMIATVASIVAVISSRALYIQLGFGLSTASIVVTLLSIIYTAALVWRIKRTNSCV